MSEVAEPRPGAPRWGVAGWAFVVLAFLVGFYNYPLRTVGWNFDHLPGETIDSRLNCAVLDHGYRYLTGKVDHFWDIGSFYPVRGVTAWSDAHIGMVPFYSALRACGLSQERSFQVLFLILFVLNFSAATWAGWRLGLGPVGSAITGYVFAFGLPVVAQTGHEQLLPRFLVPVAVVFAWEWLRAPRSTWRLAVVGACVVYQTYISVYIGYFLGLLLVAWMLAAVLVSRGRLPWRDLVLVNWRVWVMRVAVVALSGASLWPLADAHIRNGSELPKEHVHLYAPRPRSWLTPPSMTAAFPEFAEYTKLRFAPGAESEHTLSPGILSIFGVAVGLLVIPYVLIRSRAFGGPASAMAVAALAAVFLALLVTKSATEEWEDWYYRYLLHLPGTTGIRAIGRIALVLTFPAGFALAALVDFAVRGAAHFSRFAAVAVALVALGLVATDHWLTSTSGPRQPDWWLRIPLADAVQRRERVAEAIRSHPNPKLVYAFPSAAGPLGSGCREALQPDVMLAAHDLGLPTVNGWSGREAEKWGYPADYRSLMKWLTETHQVPPEMLEGLVIIGEPVPDPDPRYEAEMRAKYPPVIIK